MSTPRAKSTGRSGATQQSQSSGAAGKNGRGNANLGLNLNSSFSNVAITKGDGEITELGHCYAILDPLLRRLKQHQPTFEDEDLASPQAPTILSRSPSRKDEEFDEDDIGGERLVLSPMKAPLETQLDEVAGSTTLKKLSAMADTIDPQKFDKPKVCQTAMDFITLAYQFLAAHERRRPRSTPTSLNASINGSFAGSNPEDVTQSILICWTALGQLIETLVVYGNERSNLLQDLMTKQSNLHLALKTLERARYLAGDADFDARMIQPKRHTDELNELEGHLIDNNVPEPLMRKLVTSFSQYFLVDAALPPAVCSGRHEAAHNLADAHKSGLCSLFLQPKSADFINQLVRQEDYKSISHLMAIALTATYKKRTKLCEMLSSKGFFQKVVDTIFPRRSSQRALIEDEDRLTWCLDILCGFSQPSGEEEEENAKLSTPRKKKPPTWVSDPHLKKVIEGCFNILAETSAKPLGGGGTSGRRSVYIVKVTVFLENCIKMESVVLFEQIIKNIEAVLDHVFCRSVDRLLPLIFAVLQSPLVLSGGHDDWFGMINGWFNDLNLHAGFSGQRAKFRNREYCSKLEPFLRFASQLSTCDPRWHERAKVFLEKSMSAAQLLIETNPRRENMMTATARRAVECLRKLGVEGTPSRAPTQHTPTQQTRPSQASSADRSNRKRGRSSSPDLSTVGGGVGSPLSQTPPKAPTTVATTSSGSTGKGKRRTPGRSRSPANTSDFLSPVPGEGVEAITPHAEALYDESSIVESTDGSVSPNLGTSGIQSAWKTLRIFTPLGFGASKK